MKKIIYILIFILSAGALKAQTLKEYLIVAIENNPGVMAKYKAFEASIERANQSRVLPDPNFSVGYFISPVETRVGPQRARFSLSQMFPWFGTLAAKGEVNSLLAEAEYQSYLEARNKLFYKVLLAYFPLIEREKLIEVENDNLELLRALKEVAQAKFEAGSGTLADILELDIQIDDLTTQLKVLKEQKKPLVVAFNKTLNRGDEEEINVSDSLDIIQQQTMNEISFSNNPTLRELEIKESAMKGKQELIDKQGLPSFGVGLDYVLIDKRNDLAPGAMAPEDDGKNAFMPMVTVSLPIFRKKYKAAKKEAELMESSFSLQQEETLNNLKAEYELVLFEIKKQNILIESYSKQSNDAEAALDLLYTSYQNEQTGIEDILRIQRILHTYQLKTIKAETAMHNSIAKINYLNASDYGIIDNSNE